MRNVVLIRREPGLVVIPVEKAVHCENRQTALHQLSGAVDSADRSRSPD